MARSSFREKAVAEAEDGKCFFDRKGVQGTIEQLAGKQLALVIGAGSSAEAGYPNWNTLVTRLLHEVLPNNAADGLVERLISREGLVGAASIAKAAKTTRSFANALIKSLHQDFVDDDSLPQPGPTADAAANLLRTWADSGQRCRIYTTNYDTLLEEALKATGAAKNAVSHMDNSDPPQGAVAVHHLHGYIDRAPGGEFEGHDLVLCDDDYLKISKDSWQHAGLALRKKDSALLFVASSIADEDLLRALYDGPASEKSPTILVTRDQNTGVREDIWSGHDDLTLQHESLSRRRWDAFGINVLYTDWYCQNAQFLLEVALCRKQFQAGKLYKPYSDRLEEWHRRFKISTLGLGEKSGDPNQVTFKKSQRLMGSKLRDWIDQIAVEFDMSRDDRHSEGLTMHIWTRIPDRRELANAFRSDQDWSVHWAVDRRRITQPARVTAISAFCSGYVQTRQAGLGALWNSSIAVPIRIEDPHGGQLPVGVVVFMSKQPWASSFFGRLEPLEMNRVRETLREIGQEVLTV